MISLFQENAELAELEDIQELTERVISRTLASKFGCPVYACLDIETKIVAMWGIRNQGLDVVQFTIKPSELPPKVVRQIISRTKRAINEQHAFEEFERLRADVGCNVTGEIVKISGLTHEIRVKINEGMSKKWYGVFPLMEQPPHERRKYVVGQTREFYVAGAEFDKSSAQVRITLSRRPQRFVEQFLYRKLFAQGEDLSRQKLRCTKRDAGSYCIVRASALIPRNVIAAAVQELGERVYVSLNGAKIFAVSEKGRQEVREKKMVGLRR